MCRWDVGRRAPDLQKGHNAFIFKIKLSLFELQDESFIILRNVENYSPSDTVSHPTRLDIQHYRYKNVKSFHFSELV
jgi:hypothetical protein